MPMNILLHVLERNGLSFIQDITLCRHQEALSGMAATDNHQPYIGGLNKMKKPCQYPITNYHRQHKQEHTCSEVAYLEQDKFMEQDASSHIGQGNAAHNDERPDHEA